MYKVGQMLGFVTQASDELERKVRATITDVIFSEFDDVTVDKYLVDFRDDETERQVDSLYWYPHIYPTWEEFAKSSSYYVEGHHHDCSKWCVKTPVGELIMTKSIDSDFPGIYVDLRDKEGYEIPLVAVEHCQHKGLRALVWGHEYQEDYSHEICFNAK